ncbi:serine integrase [Arthrobacter phage KeAlii]|uniref:Serine integrase n=1 Tax=Arthrobacter phage KeAlii TaxID=2885973 RepID=A0AA94WSM0_9CAUD|nr:serine integrase [Arthrobacter phage KeAlii]UDL14653.1 serine integrase [Arthrobacter phage KeAlii]
MNDSRKAVLYLRLSAVVDDSTSIDRQERDLRAHAERQGWTVSHVLVDEGISGRKARAKAAEAVRLIADGDADVLAVWKLDRFTRQGWDGLGALSRALDARKASGSPALFVALQDGLTSDQSAFRLIAGVLSEVARSEADNAAARIKNSISYRKLTTSKYTGGAAVPFGYRSVPAPDGVGRVLIHDPEEAAIVREVSARLLSGVEPLSKIGADLQARGVPTSKSPARRALRAGEPADGLDRGLWRSSTLRSLFTSDLLLGRVRHHGDLIRDDDGLPASVWPPLLDLATLEALRARLTPSEDRPRVKGRAARLLSGIAYCAVCESRLYVTSSSGRPVYACASSWNSGSCPSPKINALGLEDHVSARFLAFAGDWPEVETITSADTTATEAALREVEAALREASAAMLEDGADLPALAARIGTLKARRDELRALPAVTSSRTVLTGRTLAEAWQGAVSDEVKRSLLLEVLDSVTVAPTASRRAPIDPDRVEIRWQS